MDEAYLSWLGMIPGIGRKKAAALGERFPTLEALRAAPEAEIASVEGFGPVLAKRVKDFADQARVGPDFWYKGEAALYLCPSCGRMIAKDAARCPFCGEALEGEEPAAPASAEIPELEEAPAVDVLQAKDQSLNLCPSCGAFVGKDLTTCPKCGTPLEGEEEVAPAGESVAAAPSADALQPEKQGLYLCPSCGAMVGADAAVCPKCGSPLEGEEAAEPAEAEEVAELPPGALTSEPSLFICTSCGAFLRPQDMKCPSCGIEFEEGEIAAETLAEAREEGGFFPICPNCGALVPSAAKKCVICGHRMGEPVAKPSDEKLEEPGITKDFLERWRRVSEERAETPEQKLLRELQQYDEILAADPTVERAWLKKIGILLRLGRVADAVAAYEKLADVNPTRDEDYRLQVLSILRTQGDLSMLPRRWSQVAATEPARELVPKRRVERAAPPPAVETPPESPRVLQALTFYEKLLAADPSLVAAWQTKAELLERLGRRDEARAALARADDLQRAQETPSGLRSSAPRLGPRSEGRVNGTTGRTNGRVNGSGRTNGRVNGSGRTNGRVNGSGRTNGRVNGLVALAGRTNGMTSGVAPGEGMVNGLVNGNGFTNGSRGRWAPPKSGGPRDWMRSVVGIASAVFLLLMIPILATLFSIAPLPGGIAIDGDFQDWAGVATYRDGSLDQVANPDVNLMTYRVRAADGNLLVYASVAGTWFRASAGGGDSLYAFVDEDGNPATGFRAGTIGAERAVEFYGWNGTLQGTSTWTYNAARAGASSDDWRAFDLTSGGEAASRANQLEARIVPGSAYDESRARVLLQALDRAGNDDAADGVVGAATGALAVTQRTVASEVVSGTSVTFLAINVTPLAPPVGLASLAVEELGSYPRAGILGYLYNDVDADGVLDATDGLVATSPFSPTATFSIQRTLSAPAAYLFAADLPTPIPNASIGFRVLTVTPTQATIPVTLREADLTMSYLEGAPVNVTVDGAFADWARYAVRLDGDDDVQTIGQALTVNENIDLRLYDAVVAANVSLYLRVDGRILGGVDIPNTRDRTPVQTVGTDADGDFVPDAVEETLGPLLAFDFNNDNVSDADQFNDVDQDGVLDYNKCLVPDCTPYSDYVLEATIPAWYPPAYAGQVARRYIGPITLPPQRGVDTAFVYVDRDNRTDTGLLVGVGGVAYGMDYAFEAVGRGGAILQAAVYRHNASLAIPWEKVADVPTAIDTRQLEASFDAALVNLTANHTFVFVTTDWQFNADFGSSGPRRAPGPSTRSVSGNDVVINEISPRPNQQEWVELANPGSTAVNLNGWQLQRKVGGNWVTIYTFTQTIGAWGSGSEYLAVDLPTNTLPNGVTTIRLRAADGTIVDQTTYPSGIADGRSWARFKHPTTGKPIDTDVDGNDFYISAFPSKAEPNDRHRPRITVAKIANRATAAPGDLIMYTVYYNNTDTGRANWVWVNDTLPADVAFVSSSVAYNSTDGKVYRWVFTNVGALTPNSFTITVRVNATAANNQVLKNTAGLNYTDQLSRKLPATVATSNTTVVRPVITVAKIVDKATAMPGDTLVYTVFYNNTGSAVANHVWLNDTLPVGVTYQSASPAPNTVSGQNLFWHFTNVAVGGHSLTITVVVDVNPPGVLVNWAFLNYTAQNDYKLLPSADDAITAIPEFETVAVPIVFVFVLYGLRRTLRKKEG